MWEELAILREELCSLKTKLRRCGVDLFQDVAEGLEGVALLAAEQGQQAAQQGASVSFAVYLCSRKHTAKELNTCAWISKHGLRDCLKEIKVRLREQLAWWGTARGDAPGAGPSGWRGWLPAPLAVKCLDGSLCRTNSVANSAC